MRVIVHNKIKCNKCKDVIESFNRHDFKWCKCHSCAVDGGQDYLRRAGNDFTDLSEFKEVEGFKVEFYTGNQMRSFVTTRPLEDIIESYTKIYDSLRISKEYNGEILFDSTDDRIFYQ